MSYERAMSDKHITRFHERSGFAWAVRDTEPMPVVYDSEKLELDKARVLLADGWIVSNNAQQILRRQLFFLDYAPKSRHAGSLKSVLCYVWRRQAFPLYIWPHLMGWQGAPPMRMSLVRNPCSGCNCGQRIHEIRSCAWNRGASPLYASTAVGTPTPCPDCVWVL